MIYHSQIFGIGIGLTAILSLLTPVLGKTVTSMIVIRVLQGLAGKLWGKVEQK